MVRAIFPTTVLLIVVAFATTSCVPVPEARISLVWDSPPRDAKSSFALTVTNEGSEPVDALNLELDTGPRLSVASVGGSWSSVTIDRSFARFSTSEPLKPGDVLSVPITFDLHAGFFSYDVTATGRASGQPAVTDTVEVRY